jgi:hypothetical protein
MSKQAYSAIRCPELVERAMALAEELGFPRR